jgi:serine/threonine protein kinase/Flp pilus assembly protein TadD
MSREGLGAYEQLTLEAAARVDAACDGFEKAWKAARSGAGAPQLSDFLDSFEDPERTVLAGELVALDQACRERYGCPAQTRDSKELGVAAQYTSPSPTRPLHGRTDVPAGRPADWPRVPGLELLEVLGSGGMGVVFKAQQPTLDRHVAVKFLRNPHVADAAHRDRFKQEARAVARLQHPNLVRLYEFGNIPLANGAGSQPYLVLEYVSGGSLADRLRGARLPHSSAARLVESLAEAIQYAHEQGVIHRDLKPANILLQESGVRAQESNTKLATKSQVPAETCLLNSDSWTPKITDFGLAKFLAGASLTVTGDLLGTPSYMAPEQTTGKSADITPAVDVYGLGAILYEALSGRPPFAGETRAVTIRQVQESEPVPPRRLEKLVPSDLETICLKCLRKEPGRRYASAQELANDLRRFRMGEPIRARPVGTAERVLVLCRRRPLVAGLVAALAIVLLAGMGSVLWQWELANEREGEVQRERQLAQTQKERDDENLKQLREKVDRLTVLGRDLAKDPRLKKTALALLEEALAFYDRILPKETMDPRLRAEAIKMCGEVASTYHWTGKWHQSVDAYRRQAELLTAMVRDEPASPELKSRLASSYNNCGHVLRDLGETPEARTVYQKAVEIQESLVADSPNDLNLQTGLANILLNQVTAMSSQSEADEIEKILRRAVKLNRAAVDADGPGSRFLFGLALAQDGLGWHLLVSGKLQESMSIVDESLEIYKRLLAAEAQNENLKRYVARAYTFQGDVFAASGKAQDAEQSFQEAVKLLTPLVEHAKGDPFYRIELARALTSWGDLLKNTPRKNEAEALLCKAIGHYKTLKEGFPEAEQNSLMLASNYLKQVSWLWEFGRSDDAAEPYRLAFEVAPENPQVNNELAWFLVANPEPRLWNPAKAVQLALKTVRARPKHATFWNTLGVAHYRNGDDKAAIAALETSMSLNGGGDSLDWFFLAMAQHRRGNAGAARKYLDQAVQGMVKHMPNNDELRRFRAEAEATLDAAHQP